MTWEILNIIGTLAFAISGAIIAMEEDYDILGVQVLGFTTAFGGSTIRNLLIGIPIETIWTQGNLFLAVFLTNTLIFLIPNQWLQYWNKGGILFDAMGLASFAIQGAFSAVEAGVPLSAVLVAATLTGCGGGMTRDVLAGRKPMILRKDIYALWATLGGLMIGLGFVQGPWATGALFVAIVTLRMLSEHFNWKLPQRSIS
ncbi:trimeric intracellular cation channel family protein [Oceanobacillus piezotolerans]|uniref:Trimeric intracellular cation channel family protein n=1 Tax=Oceanobacillus piezotolerans TaxID=2448030 RepID=A0A498D4V7_9BACI|nr:trimeric intracellular cation channel family protein [Oceanobacillus piezotolerans]RLL40783.1 trimeric intracellular cation channel family protein [Oceanobacillus piezotolerans]